MTASADYRRAWLDMHEAADQFRTLPCRHTLTPEQLAYITARLQRTVGELMALHNSHIPETR